MKPHKMDKKRMVIDRLGDLLITVTLLTEYSTLWAENEQALDGSAPE